ncbi:aldehyde dehydrogenase family-domain-containing protein [Aspergillus karnatakaensis]|uniref:aldehyde dehydrogenase family-domain-containing protein n=1 Tax=Aspergillus karnatakaensis TaxID=1810916 RepID=UPI003CCCC4CF
MSIVREEIFGPVVASAKFSSEEQVIRWANDTSYGLAAVVFSKKVSRAHIMAGKLQTGMVWINSSGILSVALAALLNEDPYVTCTNEELGSTVVGCEPTAGNTEEQG